MTSFLEKIDEHKINIYHDQTTQIISFFEKNRKKIIKNVTFNLIKEFVYLKVMTVVQARLNSGLWSLTRIVGERKTLDKYKLNHLEYYRHHKGANRRKDEWKKFMKIKKNSVSNYKGLKNKNVETRKKIKPEIEIIKPHVNCSMIKNMNSIKIGKFSIKTWYFSPFPQEFQNIEKIYISEVTLKFFIREKHLFRYSLNCKLHQPPGYKIYNHSSFTLFQIDGEIEINYCRNLCWIAKLFLDHKTLFWDVNIFLFYVLYFYDKYGFHIIGYFSKIKNSTSQNNMACLLVFPPYQKKGFGRFLIEYSYKISINEGKVGTPERPLSEFGLSSFRSYWASIINQIVNSTTTRYLTIEDLSKTTGIYKVDIMYALHHYGMLKILEHRLIFDTKSFMGSNKNIKLCRLC